MYELYENEHYPALAGLAYLRRWLDGFLSIVEGYLLTFSTVLITLGISMSMFDFLTNGAALNNPTVFTVWAGVQTVAIDAQFINMWFRLKVAIRERRFWLAAMYLLIGLILAFVTFGASVIPAIQKSTGVSFDSAISATGLNPLWMIYARYSVVILLGIIGAFSRSVIHFDETGKAKKVAEENTEPNEKEDGLFVRLQAFLRSLLPVRTEQKAVVKETVENDEQNVLQNTEPNEKEHLTEHSTEPLIEASEKPLEAVSEPVREHSTEHVIHAVRTPVERSVTHKKKGISKRGNGVHLVQQEMAKNPDVSNATICKNTGLSPSYVSTTRARLQNIKAVS